MERTDRQVRTASTRFEVREAEGQSPHISGYFSVFNSTYEIAPGLSESIAPGAFSKTLGNDIRALINHDTTLVLGRNKAGTLLLREDEHGLWGDVEINPNDQDAVNLYERVKRGDVDQCSFGFEIVSEETENRADGSIHFRITEVNLHEVSVCTFPAYEATSVQAREAQRDAIKAQRLEDIKTKMREELRAHGA